MNSCETLLQSQARFRHKSWQRQQKNLLQTLKITGSALKVSGAQHSILKKSICSFGKSHSLFGGDINRLMVRHEIASSVVAHDALHGFLEECH